MGRKKRRKNHPRIGNLKWCYCCSQYKDINKFYLSRSSYDGHVGECKSCRGGLQKEFQHNYYLKHREDLLPKHRVSARVSYYNRKYGISVKS